MPIWLVIVLVLSYIGVGFGVALCYALYHNFDPYSVWGDAKGIYWFCVIMLWPISIWYALGLIAEEIAKVLRKK